MNRFAIARSLVELSAHLDANGRAHASDSVMRFAEAVMTLPERDYSVDDLDIPRDQRLFDQELSDQELSDQELSDQELPDQDGSGSNDSVIYRGQWPPKHAPQRVDPTLTDLHEFPKGVHVPNRGHGRVPPRGTDGRIPQGLFDGDQFIGQPEVLKWLRDKEKIPSYANVS